jgi:hypothetical protein
MSGKPQTPGDTAEAALAEVLAGLQVVLEAALDGVSDAEIAKVVEVVESRVGGVPINSDASTRWRPVLIR